MNSDHSPPPSQRSSVMQLFGQDSQKFISAKRPNRHTTIHLPIPGGWASGVKIPYSMEPWQLPPQLSYSPFDRSFRNTVAFQWWWHGYWPIVFTIPLYAFCFILSLHLLSLYFSVHCVLVLWYLFSYLTPKKSNNYCSYTSWAVEFRKKLLPQAHSMKNEETKPDDYGSIWERDLFRQAS